MGCRLVITMAKCRLEGGTNRRIENCSTESAPYFILNGEKYWKDCKKPGGWGEQVGKGVANCERLWPNLDVREW